MSTSKRGPHLKRDWIVNHDHPRRGSRLKVAVPVSLKRTTGEVVRGFVSDLSLDGLRVTCTEEIEPGESLKVELGGDAVEGAVVWAEGPEIGVSVPRRRA